jgi:soluble lytic murein transglycosylase
LPLVSATDPLKDLKAGVTAYEAKRYPAAIAALTPLGKRIPELADYVAWFLASAQSESKDYGAVPKTLEAVWKQSPASPLVGRAALLAADSYSHNMAFSDAAEMLRRHYASLAQPDGDMALAQALEASGKQPQAAEYYQHVFFGYPLSKPAPQAEMALDRLKISLGTAYPSATVPVELSRALKLAEAGLAVRARRELEALIPQLTGADKDLARVRVGVALYKSGDPADARKYLAGLTGLSAGADAERIYYLHQSARKLGDTAGVAAALQQLGKLYPGSAFREELLSNAGDKYLVENQPAQYEPLYRGCYEATVKDARASVCHWKVTWSHYLHRQSDAEQLLKEHLTLFPKSDDASGALYFLGRIAEAQKDQASAAAYYAEILRGYPNHYYAAVARQRLASVRPRADGASAAEAFLKTIRLPPRSSKWNFEPSPISKQRIARSRMLASMGLEVWAEGELRFGADKEDQPQYLATELSSLLGRTNPAQALRYVKHYSTAILDVPFDSAPEVFWRAAFPLPYRDDLDRFSKANGLDPFLVAGLIRQESEFDASITSYAGARGLTQLMPATGRELSRRLKLTGFSTPRLFEPSLNLQLGTFYLKMVTNQLSGNTEAALAAYNAGLSHAKEWLTWGEFREPSEFVETVPFTQTRGYIQAVLRNADLYRRTWADAKAAAGQ